MRTFQLRFDPDLVPMTVERTVKQTDLKRLRAIGRSGVNYPVCRDAADEIEALRAELARLRRAIRRLRDGEISLDE